MSTTGDTTLAPSQMYFCHQCNRVVTLSPSPNSDLSCPNCNGGFLEEYDSTLSNPSNPNPNPFSPFTAFPDPFSPFSDPLLSSRSPVLFSSTAFGLPNPRNSSSDHDYHESPLAFNAFDFLQNYLQNLRANGANVQFVVENHPSEQNFRFPANLGDYFLGPGLEQLIQQLAENDPNRYGTPPASKRSVQGLPDVVIREEELKSDSNSCAVCMNEFEVGLKVKQMPCSHLYHSECLIPWLELHNSCPVCRYELPTDDPDYENRRASQGSNVGSESAGTLGSPNAERRFRISLPWPFTSFGGSNDGGGGNNSGSSSGVQQSGSQDSEPRPENLD